MKGVALLGGAAALGAILLWHGSSLGLDQGGGAPSRCQRAGAGPLCEAGADLGEAIERPIKTIGSTDRLPPPETSGAIDAAITQSTIDQTICRPGYARSRRPPYAVTGPLKRRMMEAGHEGERMADYELDHLVPISLGGAPLDARNLWLQPRQGRANAADKNVLAYVLWCLTCERRMSLATAQRAISRNWIAAYDTYATPGNVAKYHFRHRDGGRDRSDRTPPD